ncbi:hypothetical protein EAX61_10325 [Dokdonia sinensis]|uniref:Lipocalin-like domain-containing protein n=1 Tax=Dokdonia sinensis TaxID=2479847 RepID=A0A3M0FZS3_9FLAO|nr:hypothetical protein [Dokdonia sinensis]RMB58005.1 hypothetical protein EAX61_10325 [Dokdonia sinensis]
MKSILIITTIFLFLTSCSTDDSESDESTFVLSGTSWVGTGETIPERTITFTSEQNYTYIEPGAGGTIRGTYIFSSSTKLGEITDDFGTVPFTINNDLLIINYDLGTDGYVDTNGQETFIQE